MSRIVASSMVALGLAATALSAETRTFEGWNIRYESPSGWRSGRRSGVAEMLVADDGSLITIACGVDANSDEALRNLGQFLSAMQVTAVPSGEPKKTRIGGRDALVIDGQLHARDGRTFGAHFVVLFDKGGTSLWVCGIAAAGRTEAVSRDVDGIVGGADMKAPTPNQQAIAALAGAWVVDTGSFNPGLGGGDAATGTSHNERVAFDGQGRFEYSRSSAVYVSDMPADVDPVSQVSDQGTYSVIGSALVLRGSNGTMILEMQVNGSTLVVGGKTYRR